MNHTGSSGIHGPGFSVCAKWKTTSWTGDVISLSILFGLFLIFGAVLTVTALI